MDVNRKKSVCQDVRSDPLRLIRKKVDGQTFLPSNPFSVQHYARRNHFLPKLPKIWKLFHQVHAKKKKFTLI